MAEPSQLDSISPVLIANRGEIAVRVARTVRALGLEVATAFTAPDEGAPHVLAADRAARVARYLDADALVEAARRLGARSVHPGYGFLSESPAFARAAVDAGLVWVGPPPEAIELMGDKGRSKELAREAGVPVVPGTGSEAASAEEISAFASEHGFPILIKALAGGGGKGMRVVRSAEDLESAVAAAAREAEAAFGDGRVLAERYLERPRHVEIQVLADRHGNAVHLGERECSLQRRHQKVVEEAPSPVVGPGLRERMGAAAVELARACGYENAGTVEMLIPDGQGSGDGGAGEFHFLEMNTRLQVEHPVTELVHGIDLVEQQLRVAAGERLDPERFAGEPSGHAIEARLYAEDPAAGFLPATGTVRVWREPAGPGVRVDGGIAAGRAVGTEFDPMLAKVIAHGPDRPTALRRLRRALAELELLGVANNATFLRSLLERDDVGRGEQDTGLVERCLPELELEPPEDLLAAAAMGLVLEDFPAGSPAGPWRRSFAGGGEVTLRGGTLSTDEGAWQAAAQRADAEHLLVELDGIARRYTYARDGDSVWIGRDGHQRELRLHRPGSEGGVAPEGSLEAPMPGTVLSIAVADGDRVAEGDVLVVLESMKMELEVRAPHAGEVQDLGLSEGDRVTVGQPLVAVSSGRNEEEEE